MSEYNAVYAERFVQNLRRYASRRQQIKRRVERVLSNPYANTEFLEDASGKLDLRGAVVLQAIDRGNVGMIQRREHLRFALEAPPEGTVLGQVFAKKLDGDGDIPAGIVGAIDFGHAAPAEESVDPVAVEERAPNEIVAHRISLRTSNGPVATARGTQARFRQS